MANSHETFGDNTPSSPISHAFAKTTAPSASIASPRPAPPHLPLDVAEFGIPWHPGSCPGEAQTFSIASLISAVSATAVIAGILGIIFWLDKRDRDRSDITTTAAASGQPLRIPSQSQPQSSLPMLLRRRLFQAAKWVVVTVVATLGLAASVYQLGNGPFWWTAPEVDPGPPDYSEPFNVPFTIYNRSVVFSITEANFYCRLREIITDANAEIHNVTTIGNNISDIQPLHYPTFRCWFPFSLPGKITKADINIFVRHKHALPWNDSNTLDTGTFHWDLRANPPRWLKGDIIQ